MSSIIRPPISEAMKQKIVETFAIVPKGKSGALLAIVDENGARLHVAHKFNDTWKVGGVVGYPLGGKPFGTVALEATW